MLEMGILGDDQSVYVCAFRFRFLEDWDVWVSIFPHREEIPVRRRERGAERS